jgi:glycosyltransferase involved in cell wall biosynthesis
MSRVGIVAMSNPALGGTFQYTLSMIDALRKIQKHSYTIFTTQENHCYDDLGLPIRRLPSAWHSLLTVIWTRLHPGANDGLFGDMEKLISPIYSTRLLASRRPFLFTLHDMQERYYPGNFTFAKLLWRGFVNRSLSHAAAGIICESNHVKSDIHRFLSVDPSKISVIPAPPVSDFLPDNLDPAALRRLAADLSLPDQYLFYPAQFFPHKNHVRLLDAFARVLQRYPDCFLVLTGQEKFDFGKVMARVAQLGIQGRVLHLGHVDTDAMACAYMRATAVVLPTLFESISIPVYEAFRLGAPVCASNVVGLPEQIGDAGLLFDPNSADDIADKIVQLLGSTQLRSELAARGRARIGALTTEAYANQLEAALDRVH